LDIRKQPEVGFAKMRGGDAKAGDETGLEADLLDHTSSQSIVDSGQEHCALLLYKLVNCRVPGSC